MNEKIRYIGEDVLGVNISGTSSKRTRDNWVSKLSLEGKITAVHAEEIEEIVDGLIIQAYERGKKDERRENIDTAFDVAKATIEVQFEAKIKKIKLEVAKILSDVEIAKFGTKNRVELICRLQNIVIID